MNYNKLLIEKGFIMEDNQEYSKILTGDELKTYFCSSSNNRKKAKAHTVYAVELIINTNHKTAQHIEISEAQLNANKRSGIYISNDFEWVIEVVSKF